MARGPVGGADAARVRADLGDGVDEVVGEDVAAGRLAFAVAGGADLVEDALASRDDAAVDERSASGDLGEERAGGRVEEGADVGRGRLGAGEGGAALAALGDIDRRLAAVGAVGQVRQHALGRAHADVEVHAHRRRLAAGVVLTAKAAAVSATRLAVDRHVEERAVREAIDRRDDDRVVDVVALEDRGIDGPARPR